MEAEVSSCCCRRLFSCLSPSVSSSSSSTSSLHTLLLTLLRTKRRSAHGRAAAASPPPAPEPRSPPHGRAAAGCLRPPGTPTPSSTRGKGGGAGLTERPLAEGRMKRRGDRARRCKRVVSGSGTTLCLTASQHACSTFSSTLAHNTPRIAAGPFSHLHSCCF